MPHPKYTPANYRTPAGTPGLIRSSSATRPPTPVKVTRGERVADGGRRTHVAGLNPGTRHDSGTTARTIALTDTSAHWAGDRAYKGRALNPRPAPETLDRLADVAACGGWEQARVDKSTGEVTYRAMGDVCPACWTVRASSGACDC